MPEARRPLVWSICRIAFFFTMPNSSSRPRPEKMLIVWPVHQQREDAERYRERQREQNREGMQERFELRRQHDVHEDERQREGQDEVVGRAVQLLAECRRVRA